MHSQHILFLDQAQQAASARQHVVLPPVKGEPIHDVFGEAMLEDSSTRQHRSPFDWVASVLVHAAILCGLLALPLYFTSGLDVHKLNLTFLAVPPPAGPPPAPLLSTRVPKAVPTVPVRAFVPGKLTAPAFVPRVVASAPTMDAMPPDIGGVPGGIAGGIPGGQSGGVLGGILADASRSVAPPSPLVPEGPKKPVRVGGTVKPPRLLFGPDPVYPVLAKQSRISGVVVIDAIIDEHGNVTGMQAISGPPLLIAAALKAVSQRKYEPTILDGEPTPVDLKVIVTFKVG